MVLRVKIMDNKAVDRVLVMKGRDNRTTEFYNFILGEIYKIFLVTKRKFH